MHYIYVVIEEFTLKWTLEPEQAQDTCFSGKRIGIYRFDRC